MKCRNCNMEYGSAACVTCGEHKKSHHHKSDRPTALTLDVKVLRLNSGRLRSLDKSRPQVSPRQ